MSTLIGQVLLSRFRVDAFVASGTMGAIYRVWDQERNVSLALKVLHSELAEDPHVFNHFKREANALKKLTHPNIVRFYGLYQTQDLAFLLEQYIDGPTLKDILRQKAGKPLSIQEALVYLKAVSSGLGYAHANGVVHCDVKPGNVLIDQGGNIYLADFGIAGYAESMATMMAGAGTAAYMAPEQIRGETVTPATDIYALGVMLFEMLTGQRPFRGGEMGSERGGDTANERIRFAHLHLQVPNPRLLNPNIAPEVVEVILHALSKKPEERFSNANEFLNALGVAAGIDIENIPAGFEVHVSQASYEVSAPEVQPRSSALALFFRRVLQRFAGDSSTDAPPPDVSKKKQKGKK